jgi:hypothetical protein
MANFSARCSQPSGHSFLAVPLGFIEYQPRLAEEDWANKRASRFTTGAAGFLTLLAARRFPPPWSVDELDACYIVRDQGGTRRIKNMSTN